MSDSTNAESSGITNSEATVGAALRPIFAAADQRIIVASFASHIHRVQQVCDAAVACDRKVVVTGRSMINNTKIARKLGYPHDRR
jgi:ribonuclease J